VCYDTDATPPVHTASITSVSASPATLTSADGTRFAAHLARPARSNGLGVLVLPDNRGLSGFYEQLTIRLAERGHPAVAIDYYARTAGLDHHARGEDFGDMATLMPQHLAKLTTAGLHGDIAAAIAHLRAPEGGDAGSVVSLGFCMGGRFAFDTAATRFGLAGAIGFYGYPGELNGKSGPAQRAAELTAPILGLFGGGDAGISPEVVDAFDAALTAVNNEHEFVTYPGAPHGFFDLMVPEFADAAADAWRRVTGFLDERVPTTA
jgi:carboxymethylenebutenolidase